MEMAATNHITKPNIFIKEDNIKYVVMMCLIMFALIMGRAVNNTMFYAFAGVSLVIFLVSSVSHCFSLLLFLIPFSSILKINVDGMSFFTILFFIVVLKMIIKKKSIHRSVLISVVLFAIYCFLFSGLSQVTTIITIIAGLMMIYSLRTINVDIRTSISAFAIGVIGASVIALMKNNFPIVNTFVSDSMLKLDSDNYALRFVGLQGNPNYYTLDIIILLAVIIVMMYYKKASRFFTVILITVSIFGLMSVSKSFFIAWILLIGILFILSIKQGLGKFVKFLIIVFVGGFVVYFFAHDYLNTYLFRFMEDSGSSLGSITTGRTEIWKTYIDAIFNNIKIFLFGNGLNTILEGNRGTHNTYLECLFDLGCVGGCVFIVTLKNCIGKIITRPVMWIPIFTLLFRMMAIGILTYDNLWLYLGLFVILSKDISSPIEIIK